jgi:hypothetical protein
VQDASNGKWGLPDQISRRRHGRVPDDPLMVIQRVGDERVRQAIERGIDRETVAEVRTSPSRPLGRKKSVPRRSGSPWTSSRALAVAILVAIVLVNQMGTASGTAHPEE